MLLLALVKMLLKMLLRMRPGLTGRGSG